MKPCDLLPMREANRDQNAAARHRGLRPPDDLSICGNGPSETIDPPPLKVTTFRYPNTGQQAAQLFFSWLDGHAEFIVTLPIGTTACGNLPGTWITAK